MLQRPLLEFRDRHGQLVQRGFVIVHDAIEEVVGHAIRRARDVHRALDRAFLGLGDAAAGTVVVGDQKVFPEEKSSSLVPNAPSLRS